jgi:hypothetical protein
LTFSFRELAGLIRSEIAHLLPLVLRGNRDQRDRLLMMRGRGAGEATAASLAAKAGEHVKLDPYSLNPGSLEDTDTGVEITGEAGQAAGALANSAL